MHLSFRSKRSTELVAIQLVDNINSRCCVCDAASFKSLISYCKTRKVAANLEI